MRYESALQVISFLKRNYGTPVPILGIVRNIALSYQPTHRHVRALEALGVIDAEKIGRTVLCRLRSSEATHIWLSVLALAERGRLLGDGGPCGEITTALRRVTSQAPPEGLEAIAVLEAADGQAPDVALIVEDWAKQGLLRRFRARCRSAYPGARVDALTASELAERLLDCSARSAWISRSTPIYGEQRFWALSLPCE